MQTNADPKILRPLVRKLWEWSDLIDNRVLSEALKKLEGELREVRQELEEKVAEKEAEIDRLNQKMESASQAITKAQEKIVQADADLKENSEERKQLLSRYCH